MGNGHVDPESLIERLRSEAGEVLLLFAWPKSRWQPSQENIQSAGAFAQIFA
jgi:hypothetical protein